jgi:transcription factor SOX4/11/12 (SOX group C)
MALCVGTLLPHHHLSDLSLFQTKKNSPDHIKRPMNAFMVFSHHERKKVITEDPNIHNTSISKELGRRWNELSSRERQPFIREAERLKQLHLKQFPEYKYRPAKRRTRSELVDEHRQKEQRSPVTALRLAASLLQGGAASPWAAGEDRIKINYGHRDVLKTINTNKYTTTMTINRQFKLANRHRQGAGRLLTALELGPGPEGGHWQPSPPCKVPASPRSAWPTTPDPHSSPFYGDSREQSRQQLQYSPSPPGQHRVPGSPLTTRSCPITPLSRPAPPHFPQAYTQPPSPLFSPADSHCWDVLDSASLPDLSDIFHKDIFPQAASSSELVLDSELAPCVGDLSMLESSDPAALPLALPLEDSQELGVGLDFGLMEYIH